jgi:predicted DNA-binding WGR domain protein
MATQRYEFSEGTSNKFWEIELSGATYTARWGRIGASGRNEKTQAFPDAARSSVPRPPRRRR